jgi:transposase
MPLVNAEHIKQVPGHKTDVKDSQWVAELLRRGLLKASFMPEQPVRQLRDLTRQRVQLIRQKVQVANRIQKALGDANIKLASVASDVPGVSGRDTLRAIEAPGTARRQPMGEVLQVVVLAYGPAVVPGPCQQFVVLA